MATKKEKKAASNQGQIAKYNATTQVNSANAKLNQYNQADEQNKSQLDLELRQADRKADQESFANSVNLRNALLGTLSSVGNGLNGSTTENILNMVNTRKNMNNADIWSSLEGNYNTATNAYNDAANQNQLGRAATLASEIEGLRNLRADTAANLNNINTSLYKNPSKINLSSSSSSGTSKSGSSTLKAKTSTNIGSFNPVDATAAKSVINLINGITSGYSPSATTESNYSGTNSTSTKELTEAYNEQSKPRTVSMSGYIMPTSSTRLQPNNVGGNGYYARLINGYNGR